MPYAGDLTPQQAYQLVFEGSGAVLVDVRTRAEWTYVGTPVLPAPGAQVVLLEWQSFPGNTTNPAFMAQLAASGVRPDAPVAFICRSGVRSAAAAEAATAAGYVAAYNVSDGFEGPTDAEGHRGRIAGWKVAGLPWRQT